MWRCQIKYTCHDYEALWLSWGKLTQTVQVGKYMSYYVVYYIFQCCIIFTIKLFCHDTVDGRNPAPPGIDSKLVNNNNNNGILHYQPQVVIAGFLNHQQYVIDIFDGWSVYINKPDVLSLPHSKGNAPRVLCIANGRAEFVAGSFKMEGAQAPLYEC